MFNSVNLAIIFLPPPFALMAQLETIFNHAFCAALRPLYSCKASPFARPAKQKAQYIRVRKRSAAPEAVYQLVEKAEDHHWRELELYKKINDAALGKGGGDLKEQIVVTRRQHHKQSHDTNEKGGMNEQAVNESKGQTKHRRRSAKAASNHRTVAIATDMKSTRRCRVDSVEPATAYEDRSALPADVKPSRRHQEPTDVTSDRSAHSTSPGHRQLTRPQVRHRISKPREDVSRRGSLRQPASATSNDNACFDDRNLMSVQSRLRNDGPPQCTIEMTNANYMEKTIGERAQETWTSAFQQPQMDLPQSSHLVFGADDPTVSLSSLIEPDEA